MKQEEWINEILNEGNHINKVMPSQDLLNRLNSISEVGSSNNVIPIRTVWLAAAGLAVLIFMNVFTMKQYSKSQKSNSNDTNVVESYYEHLTYYEY